MYPFSIQCTHFPRIFTPLSPLARQALLAKRLGKKRIIAETGAGQHGVATATACALMGMELTVYMGAEDCRRQSLNVFRMKVGGVCTWCALPCDVVMYCNGGQSLNVFRMKVGAACTHGNVCRNSRQSLNVFRMKAGVVCTWQCML